MKLRFFIFVSSCVLSSCVIPPPHFLGVGANAGMPTSNADGKFVDTPQNRAFFYDAYQSGIQKEADGVFPQKNWEERWRTTCHEIDNHSTPQFARWKKATIRKLRRDAGLQVWSFMY